jgi:hypothetical protein
VTRFLVRTLQAQDSRAAIAELIHSAYAPHAATKLVFKKTAPRHVGHNPTGLRRRILRAFVGRGLLESIDAKEMLAYQHSGFSVDAGVCIEAHDRAALERLLR